MDDQERSLKEYLVSFSEQLNFPLGFTKSKEVVEAFSGAEAVFDLSIRKCDFKLIDIKKL